MRFRLAVSAVLGFVVSATLGPTLAAGAATRPRVQASATIETCRAGQLSIRFVRSGVASGNVLVELEFVNKSTHRCQMNGYPKVQMLTASGADLPTTVRDTGSFAEVPRQTVVLRSGSAAYFALYYPDATGFNGLRCPSSAALAVTPPDDTHAVVFAGSDAEIEPFGGNVIHLHCGEIDVSPVTASREL